MTTDCIFCAIVGKQAPAEIVQESKDVLAIIPLDPVTPGHVIVMPKVHVVDALEYPDVTAITMAEVCKLAQNPCNIIINVGKEATQSIFHLHIHIVPRKKDDGLALPWYSGKGNHK